MVLPFTGGARQARLAVGGAVLASVAATVLLAPWSFSLFGADAATLGAQPRPSLSFATLLHFHTGRSGAGLAPWGIVAAAVVPLAIATGPRLAWAMRAWALAVVALALAWLPGRLSAGATVLSPNGVLVAAAIGLAFAAGLGVAAVLDDLRRFHFGWRQIMMVVAGAGLALAVVGLAADTLSGRFSLHADDWPGTYSWMADNVPAGGFRVLWVGDPNVLPVDAKVVGDVGFALTRDGVGRRALVVGGSLAEGRSRPRGHDRGRGVGLDRPARAPPGSRRCPLHRVHQPSGAEQRCGRPRRDCTRQRARPPTRSHPFACRHVRSRLRQRRMDPDARGRSCGQPVGAGRRPRSAGGGPSVRAGRCDRRGCAGGHDDPDRTGDAAVVGGGERRLGRDRRRSSTGSQRRLRVDECLRPRRLGAGACALLRRRPRVGGAIRGDRDLDRALGPVVRDAPAPGRVSREIRAGSRILEPADRA